MASYTPYNHTTQGGVGQLAHDSSSLSYAVRGSFLLKYFGLFCLVVAGLTLFPLGLSLFCGETAISVRYVVVICGLAGLGSALARLRVSTHMQVNEAMVLAALLFLFMPLVMAYPMMGGGLNYLDALFEAISGATTTGLSTIQKIEEMPQTFLFARAWMQWYGGLGIVLLSLALVVRPGLVAKALGGTEAKDEDLIGSTKAHARRVLVVYLVLTGAGILLLWLLRARPFDAVVYSLASVSTGGFAPHSDSLSGLGGLPIQMGVTLICLAGATPLVLYERLHRKRPHLRTDVLQLRTVFLMGVVISLLLGLSLHLAGNWSWPQILHHTPLLAFSAQTTAGFSTLDLSQLDAASKLVLIIAMVVGGGIGSTAGGFKVMRLLIGIQALRVLILRASLARHAVFKPRLAGYPLEETEIREALLIMMLFVAVIVFSWLPFIAMGYDPLDSLFEVTSATGTVGLSVGLTSWQLPGLLKGILCADMLMGRLEIIAWFLVLTPRTWVGRRLSLS